MCIWSLNYYTIMYYLIVAATVLCILMILKIMQRRVNIHEKNNNPPGPRGLPFIGNLHQFDKAKPHIYLWQVAKKYGPLAYLKHGSKPILLVSSPKMVKEIFKTQDLAFCSRPPVFGQQKLSYGGLDLAFSPYNNHWKEMRKICVLHLLSPKQVHTFRPIREDEVSRMINKIGHLASSSQPANLSEIAMSLSSNLICRVAFGRRYDDDEYEKMRFDRLIIEAQALMVSFYWSDHFPLPRVICNWLDNTARLDRNCRELDVFYQQLIEEHLDPLRPKLDKEDILDLVIGLKEQNSTTLNLTWDHIKALLMNLIVAGTDTVTASIVWAMTALMLRPSLMKKAQEEIRQVIGRKGSIDEDDIKKLPYLKAVVLETLRLYPPAPLMYRKQILEEQCVVDGYKIKPGTTVFINGWAIARDPETWQNPDDFCPQRFLTSTNTSRSLIKTEMDSLITSYEEFSMIPFGGGRRGCPGMAMGLVSTELALANLLYTIDWRLPSAYSPDGIKSVCNALDTHSLPGLTMHKKTPLVLLPTNYMR